MSENISANASEGQVLSDKTFLVYKISFLIMGFAMFAYHMISTQKLFFNNFEHQNVHLVFSLLLVF